MHYALTGEFPAHEIVRARRGSHLYPALIINPKVAPKFWGAGSVFTAFRLKLAFKLPEQLDSNLPSLEQLRRGLETNDQRVATLQERKGVPQKQAVEADLRKTDRLSAPVPSAAIALPQTVQLEMKKKELDSLLQRYSNKHPDVIRAKREIQAIENDRNDTVSGQPRAGF